jgi:hypothetical protein
MAGGPTAAEHLAWAQENERFYQRIGGANAQFPQWAMAALFYTALHEIQAALVATNNRRRNHKDRQDVLRAMWPKIAALYDGLYTRSKAARYECVRHSSVQLIEAEMLLREVRAEIAALNLPPY